MYDDSVPLPEQAERELVRENPRLSELRSRYAALDLPVLQASRWTEQAVEGFLDLRYFRGETLITWHYRELLRVSRLKYFLYARYVQERDKAGLLGRLKEDGAFGCWTFAYSGLPLMSRDLLESVNEIAFLERQLAFSNTAAFPVLDIGAGYGRLAHRMTAAFPQIEYWCVDAIADSTFISEWYLGFRGCDRARVVALDEVEDQLPRGHFGLAVNIHSFSECPLAAIEWWVNLLDDLRVPRLLVIPNEPKELLSLEVDGSRHDFLGVLERADYHLTVREPVIADAATRELLELHDHFHLFVRG